MAFPKAQDLAAHPDWREGPTCRQYPHSFDPTNKTNYSFILWPEFQSRHLGIYFSLVIPTNLPP